MKKILINFILSFITLTGFTVGGLYYIQPPPIAQTKVVQAQPEVAEPSTLSIPALNLNVEIEQVGEDENGRMGIPKVVENGGWWKYGAKPGEFGSAVIAGHVDTPTGETGIFYDLDDLVPGDVITVTDVDGMQHDFKVEFVQIYQDDDFPIDVVFERTDKKRLNLITCSGSFNIGQQNYEERLVVFASALE